MNGMNVPKQNIKIQQEIKWIYLRYTIFDINSGYTDGIGMEELLKFNIIQNALNLICDWFLAILILYFTENMGKN